MIRRWWTSHLKISWNKRTPFSLRSTPSMNEPWSPAGPRYFCHSRMHDEQRRRAFHGLTTSHGLGIQVSLDVNGELTSSYQVLEPQQASGRPDCVERAVHWAQVTQNPLQVESEAVDAPVLMTSEGFSPLFSMVVPPAMTGEKWSERNPSGREPGEAGHQLHALPHDNGLLEGGMSSGSRDAEGVPRQHRALVEDGRLCNMLWSTRDAAQQVAEGRIEAAASTGSASSGGHQAPPSTGCTELFLTSSEAPRSMEALLAHMGDGYVVNSVMGAHTANPSSGDFRSPRAPSSRSKTVKSLAHSSKQVCPATLRKRSTGRPPWSGRPTTRLVFIREHALARRPAHGRLACEPSMSCPFSATAFFMSCRRW